MSTAITISIGVIVLLFLIDGIRRGFLRSIFEIIGFVAAFVVARRYGPELASWLTERTSISQAALTYFFSIVAFVCVILAFHLFGLLLQMIVCATVLSPVDRLGGAVLGILKGALIVSLIVSIVHWLPVPESFKQEVRSNSTAEAFRPILPKVYHFIVDRVFAKHIENESKEAIDPGSGEEWWRRRSV